MNVRQNCFVVTLSLLLPFAPLAAQGVPAPQAAAGAPAPVQADLSDPQALLATAIAANNLDELAQPWHLKASYEISGDKGAIFDIGTFEEWHLGTKRWKRTYASDRFKQTVYRTPEGFAYETSTGAPAWPESLVADQLTDPAPTKDDTQDLAPEIRAINQKDTKLTCVMLSSPAKKEKWPLGLFPTYCFNPGSPMLRLEVFNGSIQATRNQMASFHGVFISKDILLSDEGAPLLRIRLSDLASMSDAEVAAVTFPEIEKKHTPERIGVTSGVAAGNKIKGLTPPYPNEAKQRRISGTVLLGVSIGTDGRVHHLRIVSSPDDALSASSVAAVERWAYKPYLLNGQPVVIETTIVVRFALSP